MESHYQVKEGLAKHYARYPRCAECFAGLFGEPRCAGSASDRFLARLRSKTGIHFASNEDSANDRFLAYPAARPMSSRTLFLLLLPCRHCREQRRHIGFGGG